MARKPANFREILPTLSRAGVEFILIGGGAAVVHGAARVTYDVDVLYRLKRELDLLYQTTDHTDGH